MSSTTYASVTAPPPPARRRSNRSLATSTIHSPVMSEYSQYLFHSGTGRSTPRPPGSTRSLPFTLDQFETLQEMQRVLYRGAGAGEGEGSGGDMQRVDEFILENFDEECLYESPLLTLQNTQLLQHAVNLSHAVSDAQLPSLRPGALVSHTAGVMRYGWRKLVGSGPSKDSQPTTSTTHTPQEKPKSDSRSARQLDSRQGQAALASAFARFHNNATTTNSATGSRKKNEDADAGGNRNWWKAWDVRSVCGEINEMETYDGFRFGFIEHTLFLSLLPDWLDPIEHDPQLQTSSNTAHGSPFNSFGNLPYTTPAYNGQSESIATRHRESTPSSSILATTRHTLLHHLLRYKLHLHTLVEFNEAGKIVYIRDLVDLRDLWEGVVPFGRETAWIGRRLGGLALAGMGRLVFGSSSGSGQVGRRDDTDVARSDREGREADGNRVDSLGLDVGTLASAPDVDSGGEGGNVGG